MITPFGELPNRLAAGMSLAEQHEWLTRPLRRRTILKAGAAGLALPFLWSQPARAAADASIFGLHLTYGRDPSTEMIVSFASAAAFGSAHVVATAATGQVSATAAVQGVAGSPNRYGRATLPGLTPDTTYTYSVVVDGASLGGGTLHTAPAGPHAFRFTAFGDQGVSSDASALLQQLGALQPQLHLYAGDLSYADSSGLGGVGDKFRPAIWDSWLRQNQPYSAGIPWNFAVGNHEMEPGFDLHGYAGVLARVSPGGTSPVSVPTATRYQVGSVGFLALDANDVSYEIPANRGWTGGAQTAWLRTTLEAMRQPQTGIEFIVVYLHHAVYSTNMSHGSEGGIREQWVPLFDEHEVDLVISGHAHCYERTLPIRRGALTSTDRKSVDSNAGTTYVTVGGGGQAANLTFFNDGHSIVRTGHGKVTEKAPWQLPSRTGTHALICVDVTPPPTGRTTGGRLDLRAIDLNGAVIDEVRLTRPPLPVAEPAAVLRRPDGAALAVAAGGAAVLLAAGGGLALRQSGARPEAAPVPPEPPDPGV